MLYEYGTVECQFRSRCCPKHVRHRHSLNTMLRCKLRRWVAIRSGWIMKHHSRLIATIVRRTTLQHPSVSLGRLRSMKAQRPSRRQLRRGSTLSAYITQSNFGYQCILCMFIRPRVVACYGYIKRTSIMKGTGIRFLHQCIVT